MARATEVAVAEGSQTLGMTNAGKIAAGVESVFNKMGWDWKTYSRPVWQLASWGFASTASGRVVAVIGPRATGESLIYTTELPTVFQKGLGVVYEFLR